MTKFELILLALVVSWVAVVLVYLLKAINVS